MVEKVRQKCTVPFLWEEKPGTPKRDWKLQTAKPRTLPVTFVPPPLKLITSVPFQWEEIPGTPLPCFSQPPADSPRLPLPPAKLIGFPSPSVLRSSSSTSSTIRGMFNNMFRRRRNFEVYEDDDDDDDNDSDDESEDHESEEEDMSEFEYEASNFDENEMVISAPSLLAHGLVSTLSISSSIPESQPTVEGFTTGTEDSRDQHDDPASPDSETGSNTSSYATGSTNLMGASFLECLFPLFSPDSGFLDKAGCHAKSSALTLPESLNKELNSDSNSTFILQRGRTLGELILLSRKLSYGRRAVHIRKRDLPLEFMKKRLLGCFNGGTGGSGIDGFHWRQPRKRLQLV